MINPDTLCLFFLLATRFCLVAIIQAYSSVFHNWIRNWPDWYNECSWSLLGTSWGMVIWTHYDYNMREDDRKSLTQTYGKLSPYSGVGDGLGGLACCRPWGHKESTVQLNWTELKQFHTQLLICKFKNEMLFNFSRF